MDYTELIDRNGWLADKIPAFGDFGKDVALQLKKNSDAIEALVKARDEALAECEEQARLLGMSGSREAALVARNAEVERDLAALRKQIDELQPDAVAYAADINKEVCIAITCSDDLRACKDITGRGVPLYSLEGIKK